MKQTFINETHRQLETNKESVNHHNNGSLRMNNLTQADDALRGGVSETWWGGGCKHVAVSRM